MNRTGKMVSFAKRKSSGWIAVCLYPGRVDVARMRLGAGKPRVELLQSFERGDDDTQALSRLRQSFGLDRQACTTLLPVGSYQFLQTDAPDVPKTELREAVRWKIKDMVDFPVDQATLDVLDIPQSNAAPSRTRNIYVAVSRNDALAPLIRCFHDAKADLQAIDIPELAQRNLARLSEVGERGLALLSLDDSGGLLTFTAKGELYMVRRVEIGNRQLQAADESRKEQLLERIGLELQRSLDNFDRQFSSVPVNRLLLAPGPEAQAVQAFLTDYLAMPVDVMDLSAVMDISAVPELESPARQAQCLATLGAALREAA